MELVTAIRGVLAEHADPERAVGQQKYMKSAMPFRGVAMPEVRRLVGALVRAHPIAERVLWETAIRQLWDGAGFREERYAGLIVARHARHRAFAIEESSLDVYRHLILTGQWWDLCDETAHLVGLVLAAHPVSVTPVMRAWSREENLWLRRVAILSQLDRKADTDPALLAYAIDGSIDDPDFFARKGIGWALRKYARTDPEWVRSYVANHPALPNLSVREALKHLRAGQHGPGQPDGGGA